MPFQNRRLIRLLRRPWHDKVNSLHALFARLKTAIYYSRVFARVGRGTTIYKPMLLANPRYVWIGERSLIRSGARIETVPIDGCPSPQLIIGDNVNIEQNVHLICSSRLMIGNNVTITGQCAIVDTSHPFQDVNDPRKVGERIDPTPTPVMIGDNTFLGFGCVVLPGVQIGKNCVVGANSTVTRNVPDFTVVAGNPAVTVMRYDPIQRNWA